MHLGSRTTNLNNSLFSNAKSPTHSSNSPLHFLQYPFISLNKLAVGHLASPWMLLQGTFSHLPCLSCLTSTLDSPCPQQPTASPAFMGALWLCCEAAVLLSPSVLEPPRCIYLFLAHFNS